MDTKKKLPDIKTEFADWYNDVIYRASLVDHSPVRGTMVVMPYGCAIWEQITAILDKRIKATGHQNALFPLFIPQSFLQKEAEHVAGFAPELAVVTHAGGKDLEEPLIVRPTSETIIHYMFARWIKSWRDLPLKINQWANVVRWEMRPRPFLRTTEFFWQEGHTAHETEAEALDEVMLMAHEYQVLIEEYLAIPIITGRKTEAEKFPGAKLTRTFEGIMLDGKALQMGTSHLLSQSFAHAFEMKFQGRDGEYAYPHLTSWAVTTRLIGALVMTHGDEKGLCIPPRIAPIQVVIVPIVKKDTNIEEMKRYVATIKALLEAKSVRMLVDDDQTTTPGSKFYHWELKGVPVRLEIGAKELEGKTVCLVNRVSGEKTITREPELSNAVSALLERIQKELFQRAKTRYEGQKKVVCTIAEFGKAIEAGSFCMTQWCGEHTCEARLKELSASIRCILDIPTQAKATCFVCGKNAELTVIAARSY